MRKFISIAVLFLMNTQLFGWSGGFMGASKNITGNLTTTGGITAGTVAAETLSVNADSLVLSSNAGLSKIYSPAYTDLALYGYGQIAAQTSGYLWTQFFDIAGNGNQSLTNFKLLEAARFKSTAGPDTLANASTDTIRSRTTKIPVVSDSLFKIVSINGMRESILMGGIYRASTLTTEPAITFSDSNDGTSRLAGTITFSRFNGGLFNASADWDVTGGVTTSTGFNGKTQLTLTSNTADISKNNYVYAKANVDNPRIVFNDSTSGAARTGADSVYTNGASFVFSKPLVPAIYAKGVRPATAQLGQLIVIDGDADADSSLQYLGSAWRVLYP